MGREILRYRKGLALCTAVGVVLGFGAPAYAQAIPGSADPSRVEDQLGDRTYVPDVSPRVEVRDVVAQDAPPGSENIQFTLNTIEIEGVTAYEGGDISGLYQDRLGSTVSLAEIYGIANALTNKYRNEGYILTQVTVPPQTIEGGVAKLRVYEGFIDQVVIEGEDDAVALNTIQSYASRVNTGKALNVKDLERSLLLINDLPGLSARSILSPSRTTTGASDLRIIVTRDTFEGVLAADNHGSRFLGPVQFTAGGAANSYYGNNEKITAQFVAAPDPNVLELAFGAVSYEQPVWKYGTTIRTFLSHSDTTPGFNLEQFDVGGRSTHIGVEVKHPFVRSRARNFTGRIQFDWRDVESNSNIAPTVEDSIRSLRAGGRYEFLDTLLGVGINAVDIEASQGLIAFGSSNEGDANLTRAAGDPRYTKLNVEAQRLQRIASGVNLLVAARGQWSDGPLLSSEEFGVGGFNFGRAFDPSEIIGDEGFATKAEIQWSEPRPVDIFTDYQLYSFYDFGKVFDDDATTSDSDDSLASIGFGIRADFLNDIEGEFAVAFPLTREVETQNDEDPRFYVSIRRKF